MVLRVSVPGKPVKLLDLGPAVGRHHNYDAQRKTIDDDHGRTGRNHR